MAHEKGHEEHVEPLVEVTVEIEEDQVEMLEEVAREYTDKLGQRWDMSAVVRLAVGDLLTKLGKMS